ncbi:hypothetical protein GF340_01640, partial [Candidatus Peregrinibacteria bacterium]|nr:hypothetical protein [Candidatus Peregrinibacteria bacterium]
MADKKEKKEIQKNSEKKESKSKTDKTIEKLQSVFKKAILVSLLAHTPLMVGSFYPKQNIKAAPVAILSKEGVTEYNKPAYVEKIEDDLELQMTEEEVREYMDQVSEEALEGYEKAKMAVKMRQEERNKRIDSERIKQFKLELVEKLKNGEKIDFTDYVFKTEEIIMGVDPQIIANAKEVFANEVEELKKIKPVKPTREFLNKIVSYTEEDEKGPAYELTSTSVSVYLDRKSKGKRGNCQARARYTAMLLQKLYPERWNNVYFQETGNHIRTLFQIDDVFYMMEPGTAPLTEEMKEGTMIYKPDDVIRLTAGEKITAEVEEVKNKERMKNKKKGLPIITDNTAFPSPKPDKELINQGRDSSHL